MTTGYDIARSFKRVADGMPKAAQQGVLKAAAIMELAVGVASAPYTGHKIVRTRTIYLPPIGAQVKMSSPKAHLLDHDTKRHPIIVRRKPLLVFESGGRTWAVPAVNHPGTKGKFMWEKALAVATPKMEAAMSEAIGNQIVKNFI